MGGSRPHVLPGRIERGVDRLGWAVDASSEQKQKINAITQKAADDIFELRQASRGAQAAGRALAAPTIDRAKLEALRADQMKLAETATKRVTDAVADVAEVLTPAQRADLAPARALAALAPRLANESPCSRSSPATEQVGREHADRACSRPSAS
jgi:hypothetical protein